MGDSDSSAVRDSYMADTYSTSNDKRGGEQGRLNENILVQQQHAVRQPASQPGSRGVGRDTELRSLGGQNSFTDSSERRQTECTDQQRSAGPAREKVTHQPY